MTSKQRRNRIPALILAAGLLAASTGRAQGEGGERSGDDWAPIKHLTFTDEEIKGGVFAPDGTRIESVAPAIHPSLIELRQGFEAEIVKTMEDM
jgi:hypothetical protein